MVKIRDTIKIDQYGRYIRGKVFSLRISGSAPFESTESELSGKISAGGMIEGSWWTREESQRYRGTFLGNLKVSGDQISAKWLGIDSTGINSGIWEWEKVK